MFDNTPLYPLLSFHGIPPFPATVPSEANGKVMGKLPVGNVGESRSGKFAQRALRRTRKERAEVNVLSARCLKFEIVFYAAFFVMMILFRCGGVAGVFAAEALQPFASFTTREVDIDIEDGEIEVLASFTLGPGSNGLNIPQEAVTLQVTGGTAAYSVTMPSGSFKMSKNGEFNFLGTINGVKIIASIRSSRAGAFEFEVETERANVKGIANPVTVSLRIGDDGGSRTVRAKIE